VIGIDELREKRDEITKMLQSEEEEKTNIQKDLVLLTKRLAEVDDSLSRKYAYINDYDRTIEDVEAAYGKVFTSFRSIKIYFFLTFQIPLFVLWLKFSFDFPPIPGSNTVPLAI
jgi:hypothetical protein